MPDVERINRLVKTRDATKHARKLLGELQMGDLKNGNQHKFFMTMMEDVATAIRIMDNQIAEKRNKL